LFSFLLRGFVLGLTYAAPLLPGQPKKKKKRTKKCFKRGVDGVFCFVFLFSFCWGGVMQRKENNKKQQDHTSSDKKTTRNEKTLIVTDQG